MRREIDTDCRRDPGGCCCCDEIEGEVRGEVVAVTSFW